jgi:hypothetical protein
MYDSVKSIRDSAGTSGNFSGSAQKHWSSDRVNARYFVLSPVKGLGSEGGGGNWGLFVGWGGWSAGSTHVRGGIRVVLEER